MKNAFLNILAAVAMLFVAIFHDNGLIVGLGLMVVGLSFWRPITNCRQATSMVLVSLSGLLLLLGYYFWPLVSAGGGAFFVLSKLNQNKDGFSVMEMLIGLSWFGLAIPFGCFLSAILMLLLSLLCFIFDSVEEVAEIFS